MHPRVRNGSPPASAEPGTPVPPRPRTAANPGKNSRCRRLGRQPTANHNQDLMNHFPRPESLLPASIAASLAAAFSRFANQPRSQSRDFPTGTHSREGGPRRRWQQAAGERTIGHKVKSLLPFRRQKGISQSLKYCSAGIK